MRFLGDVGISPRSIERLRKQGHDAVHLHELGLARLSDSEILQLAVDENRIVLTHDLDFGELVAASGSRIPSVVVSRLRRIQADRVGHHIDLVLKKHGPESLNGAILSVTEGQIRVRRLPVDRAMWARCKQVPQ